MRGTYVGNNRMLVLPQWGGKLYTPGDDMSMTPALLIDGVIEVGFTNYVVRNMQEGWQVADVGANIGYFTTLFGYKVGPSGHVYAFEPNAKSSEFLEMNVSVNDLAERVTIREAAVSDTSGMVTFYKSKKYQGNSSMIPHPDGYFEHFVADQVSEMRVPSVTLNQDLGHVRTLDLVKIDVEGAENLVFAGMGVLMNNQVKRVVFEINQTMLGVVGALELKDRLLHYKDCLAARFFTFRPDGTTIATTVESLFLQDYTDNVLMELF